MPRTRQEILLLCAQDWLTKKDIAERLGRNPDALHAHYLKSMVSEGLLVMLHPGKPQSRYQAYKAAASPHDTP